jgi:hypothetical protein
MELLNKLRRLELVLKPTQPLELRGDSHLKISEVARVRTDVKTLLDALIETHWSHPSLAMPMKDGVLLQWDFGASGYLTLICESSTPAEDYYQIQSGFVYESSI